VPWQYPPDRNSAYKTYYSVLGDEGRSLDFPGKVDIQFVITPLLLVVKQDLARCCTACAHRTIHIQ
jgi:hypothetical protein